VPFDGILTNGKSCANLLVRVAGRDQSQYLNFADSQGFFPGVFGQLGRYLGVNPLCPAWTERMVSSSSSCSASASEMMERAWIETYCTKALADNACCDPSTVTRKFGLSFDIWELAISCPAVVSRCSKLFRQLEGYWTAIFERSRDASASQQSDYSAAN
jgi:hypothetical protein